MSDHTVAVLGFHKIGAFPPTGWPSWFYIPESTFIEQVNVLHDGGWEPIDIPRFLRGLHEPDTLPERAALLTFDDGYKSMRDVTLPLLQELDVSAVLFVPTGFVGGRNTFDFGVEPDEPICDWEDLRALAEGGVSIQSHALSHRRFSELSTQERRRELAESKAALEASMGTSVDVIAFPYGDSGPADSSLLLADAGYTAAFLYGGGPVRLPVGDPYRLERIAMGPDTDLRSALERIA
jgi:peptidoglycan/xylan/chitin deacetylase (PgdA/CDA1 family)